MEVGSFPCRSVDLQAFMGPALGCRGDLAGKSFLLDRSGRTRKL